MTPWTAARQASLSFTNSQSLLKLLSIESVLPSNHLVLCCPLLFLPLIFPSIRVFSSESTLCIRWPKDWSFSFSIRPSNEHPGLISFRMDWLDLLALHKPCSIHLENRSQASLFFFQAAPLPLGSRVKTKLRINPKTAPDNETWMLRMEVALARVPSCTDAPGFHTATPRGVRALPVSLLEEQPDAESRLCPGEALQPAAQETAAPTCRVSLCPSATLFHLRQRAAAP